jgi:hypothetical protein
MPLGFHVGGNYFVEATVLKVAHAYEIASGAFRSARHSLESYPRSVQLRLTAGDGRQEVNLAISVDGESWSFVFHDSINRHGYPRVKSKAVPKQACRDARVGVLEIIHYLLDGLPRCFDHGRAVG